jgi:pseudouridine-5'-phosphate glycosidase
VNRAADRPPTAAGDLLRIGREAQAALDGGRPIVALESTLITHGLPYPQNLDAARRAEAAVRGGGAVPATVALHGRRIRVGLEGSELAALAEARDLAKVSRQTLAAALARQDWAGTTVAASLVAAQLAGIRVFATGGIGGVHRGGERSMDISADLAEIARSPVAVVCAGPKSILDVPRTMELLETLGVPVVGWATDDLAGFFSRTSGGRVPSRVDTAPEAAALVERQRTLGLGGVLFCVPLPEDVALPRGEANAAIDQAIRDSEAAGIHGPASTPWVLGRVAELTEGRSVVANLALIEHNAAVAAAIAVALNAMSAAAG